jgi:hypothetical protein
VIGEIGVEPSFDGPRCHLERPTPRRRLDRLEVQALGGARAYERFDLGRGFRFEGFSEPPFWEPPSKVAAPASSFASHSCSLVSTTSRTKARKRRCSTICSCV